MLDNDHPYTEPQAHLLWLYSVLSIARHSEKKLDRQTTIFSLEVEEIASIYNKT